MTLLFAVCLVAFQLAAAGAVAFYLREFVSRRAQALEDRMKQRESVLEAAWRQRADLLELRIAELDEISRLLVPPVPPASGLNLSKRSQALDLLRRGEDCKRVAETLSLPRNEVELLRKVQTLLAPQAGAQGVHSGQGATHASSFQYPRPSGNGGPDAWL